MITDVFIKHHQLSLRVVGAWPTAPMLSVFYLGLGVTIFFLTFEIWDIVEVRNDLEMLMNNLVTTVGSFIGLCKIAVFRQKHRKLIDLINIIANDWRLESTVSKVMRQNCARFRLIAKCIIVLNNSMCLTYFGKTLASYIFDKIPDRKFMAPSKFPFDARQSPYYEVINIAQCITTTVHFNAHALIDGLLVTLVLHACSKVDMVRTEIRNYSKACQTYENNDNATLAALRKLYKKHLECIEFSTNIQDVFSLVAFFHISFLTLLQVMSGFMFIDGLEKGTASINLIHYALLTVSFLSTAGYYCICGEYLKFQTETIYGELCNCSWNTFSRQNREIVKFMLSKVQKPVTLTMGKFSELSLIFFTTIVKTSFSYLSLVRAVR